MIDKKERQKNWISKWLINTLRSFKKKEKLTSCCWSRGADGQTGQPTKTNTQTDGQTDWQELYSFTKGDL